MITRRDFLRTTGIAVSALAWGGTKAFSTPEQHHRPNILWILAEDASPHIGCYGERAIHTPNLDALAAEGVRFDNAFVTCPVCSPSRSALTTGVYQTTLGAHNHRSQKQDGKGGGNSYYYDSYRLPNTVPMVSDLFRKAGYYTCNGSGPSAKSNGKTDYNFINTSSPYDGANWRDCPKDRPFFAQIQLRGGKDRSKNSRIGAFSLPPYYPDHTVLRDDWSSYLNSWLIQDREVGQIMRDLRDADVIDNSVIFFLTDHGISHICGKQFLYEEGIRVPLIVRFPKGLMAGTVRSDLVLHIDLVPASLALAGIPIPNHLQGRDVFAKEYKAREFVVCARDRCDETIDIIRCVRTKTFKYIRNFMSYRPHAQENQYKDGKQIMKTMRQLHAEKKLNQLQDRVFLPTRPPEELYDLQEDPNETVNLAEHEDYAEQLVKLRKTLYDWMVETRDVGLIPEPILEDLGRKHGNKYNILQDEKNAGLIRDIIDVIEAGEKKDFNTLRKCLVSGRPSEKYWAATWLGCHCDAKADASLKTLATDKDPTLRIAALLALCKLGQSEEYLPLLIREIGDPNLIVGMYAMNAIEQTGILNKMVSGAAEIARKSKYEFTRRYGNRLRLKSQRR